MLTVVAVAVSILLLYGMYVVLSHTVLPAYVITTHRPGGPVVVFDAWVPLFHRGRRDGPIGVSSPG